MKFQLNFYSFALNLDLASLAATIAFNLLLNSNIGQTRDTWRATRAATWDYLGATQMVTSLNGSGHKNDAGMAYGLRPAKLCGFDYPAVCSHLMVISF